MIRSTTLVTVLLVSAVLVGCGKTAAPAPTQAQAQTQTPAQTQAPAGASMKSQGVTHYAIVGAESKASFHAREKFVNKELPNDAVGTTSEIKGELALDPGKLSTLTATTITVDLRTLKSDESRRDGVLHRRFLESDTYPTAEFTLKSIAGAGALQEGAEVSVKLNGTLKVHGQSKDVTWDGSAKVQGDKLLLKATTSFQMPDFGITVPDIANMLKAEPGIKLEVELTAQQAK